MKLSSQAASLTKLNTAELAKKARQNSKSAAQRLRPATLAEGPLIFSMYGTLCALILTTSMLAWLMSTERASVLFAYNDNKEVTRLIATNTPNTGSEALLNWSKYAAGEIFSYNFNDIIPRLDSARRFFTDYGWDSFRIAFQQSELLRKVQFQRVFVSTLPSGIATIISEGDVKGRYTWTVQLGIVTNYYSGTNRTDSRVVTLSVQKIPTINSPSGYPFGIVKMSQ